jgi:hypothetical protein
VQTLETHPRLLPTLSPGHILGRLPRLDSTRHDFRQPGAGAMIECSDSKLLNQQDLTPHPIEGQNPDTGAPVKKLPTNRL